MKILGTYHFLHLAAILTVSTISILTMVSCNKMLETEPKGVLGQDNMYQNVFDADAAVIGTYGKLMNLAESYVVLGELRADLMTTTVNSDQYSAGAAGVPVTVGLTLGSKA